MIWFDILPDFRVKVITFFRTKKIQIFLIKNLIDG